MTSRNDSGSESDASAIECTITEERRDERAERIRTELLPHLETIERREDGVELTFAAGDAVHEAVAGFVRREAECCSFARYRIDYAPPYETLTLVITGPDGTRDLFERGFEEYDDALDEAGVSLPE